MSANHSEAQIWTGGVAMTTGIGVFLGVSGDNKPHKHWAHQIAIGLDTDIVVLSGEKRYNAKGLCITAGTSHQLKTANVLCVYIDPTHNLCKTLLPQYAQQHQPIVALDESTITRYVSSFTSASMLQSALEAFNQQCRCDTAVTPDKRLQSVLSALQHHISIGQEVSRTELSTIAHLSPSRFSHWFSENTGLPLRSYKKWLKLLTGFELAQRMALTDAATTAGFSDQAHFCRAVSDAFGVSPTTIKQLFSQR